jgi:phage-related holin
MAHLNSDHVTTFYFFALGILTNFPSMVIIWIAIEDILAGTLWSTTIVLIVFSVPDILSKVVSPSIVSRISFRSSFVLLTLLFVGSIVLLVAIDDVRLRIVGVGVLGIGNGFAIITCVRMLAYYEQAELLANAYQSGTNASVFLASLGYTGESLTCLNIIIFLY